MSRRARERSGVWAAKRHQLFSVGPEPDEQQDDTEGGSTDAKTCGCFMGRCRGGANAIGRMPNGRTCRRFADNKKGLS